MYIVQNNKEIIRTRLSHFQLSISRTFSGLFDSDIIGDCIELSLRLFARRHGPENVLIMSWQAFTAWPQTVHAVNQVINKYYCVPLWWNVTTSDTHTTLPDHSMNIQPRLLIRTRYARIETQIRYSYRRNTIVILARQTALPMLLHYKRNEGSPYIPFSALPRFLTPTYPLSSTAFSSTPPSILPTPSRSPRFGSSCKGSRWYVIFI